MSVTHERFPKFYGVYLDLEENKLAILVEFIDGITLLELIHGKNWTLRGMNDINADHKLPSGKDLCKYFIQITEILNEVYNKQNTLVQQLKPTNIIITPQDKIYLLDYGMLPFSLITFN